MDPIAIDDGSDDELYAEIMDELITSLPRDGDAGGGIDAGATTTANDRDDTDDSNEDSGDDDDSGQGDDGREHDLARGGANGLGRAHVVRSYGEAITGAARGATSGIVQISKTLDDDAWDAADTADAMLSSASDVKEARREIGHLAVWSVASAKPGNGVELLRDDDLGTFWQSDGAQPHLVNVQFQHKALISEVALWCEFKMDESYTPSTISVRAGASCHDLREIRCVSVEHPNGWVRIKLSRESPVTASPYLRAYFVQIAILANHQNGRDTHVRQIKLFGPRRDQARMLGHSLQLDLQTPEFHQYGSVR